MTNHTPGPWTATGPKDFSTSGMIILILSIDNYPAAFVPGWTDAEDTAKEAAANARLIAAAPDMLAALRDAVGILDSLGGGETCRAVRAAIAKAEGTT